MQERKSNKNFWKDKGYYILLSLCLIAVGVSGYFFLSGAVEEAEQVQPTLSVPVEVEDPEEQTKPQPQPQTQESTQQPEEDKESEQTPAPEASGEQAAQTVMPVSGSVQQDYSMDSLTYNATTRDWRVHSGVDLAAELGTPVKAARAGTVSAVYEDDYYGATVVIRHDGGYTSHYCNLSAELSVAAGDTVSAGQTIGSVGATALLETAQESHLHFEVYCDGEPVDPAGFLY